MRITITGASGLIGSKLVAALEQRGDEVTKVSLRDGPPDPAQLAGRDAVVHLAGENVAQRWTDEARKAIRDSRERGTRQLVEAIAGADPKPRALISSSAVGYYGPHGDERLDEDTAAGHDFLAEVCVVWEREAQQAEALGLRVVRVRTGVVLDAGGGALSKMLLPFKLGGGGPVAGGRQYMPWIHVDDVVGIYLRAIDDPAWHGAVNATAPGAGDQQDVQQGARTSPAPARDRSDPGRRHPAALWRHGRDRHQGPAGGPQTDARARLYVPIHRSRRCPERRSGLKRTKA